MSAPNIETIVSLAKRRGFVFPASDIYGGLGSSWDYGSLGVELANNIKQSWWRWLVHERDDIEGLDSSIIQNRLVWKYTGHEDTFSDPWLIAATAKAFREDKFWRNMETPNRYLRLLQDSEVENKAQWMRVPCPNCERLIGLSLSLST